MRLYIEGVGMYMGVSIQVERLSQQFLHYTLSTSGLVCRNHCLQILSYISIIFYVPMYIPAISPYIFPIINVTITAKRV